MSQYPNYETTTQQQGYSDPQQYQQPSYAPSPYAYAGAPLPEHPSAQTAMILGILGLVVVQLCAPFAWWTASKAKKEIAANPGRWRADGSLQAGYIMGIIGTVLLILTTLFVILYFGVIFATIANMPR